MVLERASFKVYKFTSLELRSNWEMVQHAALGRLRQVDLHEFEASLVHMEF